jgi:poly(3-hydroxyoctanoate) depolymerase
MATRRKPPATGGTVRSVSVHGLRTRVEVRGEGPPLLLVMGLWGDIEAWDPLIERLDGFRTIAFDAPGIGGTELPAVPLSLPALGRFTAGVLDAVGVARAHVLGVSFGGLVAQQLAALAPARVDRLVLVSTSSGPLHLPGSPSALLRLFNPWTLAVSDVGAVFGGRIRRHPELLAALGLRPPAGLSMYLNRLAGLTGWWATPWSIRQPTLVVTGDDDPIVPAGNSRLLAACLSDARLHVVRSGGHLVLFDSPDEVAPVIAGFLRAGSRPVVGTLAS